MDFDSFVLAAATADLADEPAARPHADAVEFRMDRAGDPLTALENYDGELPIIATNRAAWEGGDATDDATRLDELEVAVEFPAVEAVDLELESLRAGDANRVRDVARDQGVSVIASTHDFEATPDPSDLRELLERGSDEATVSKLAVTARSRGDVLALLTATHEATRAGHRVATMAMGEVGRHSRAVGPLYGSKIGYAPVDSDAATAPGQYSLVTLADLVATLEPKSE